MSKFAVARANNIVLAAIAVLLLILGVVSWQESDNTKSAAAWMRHSYDVLGRIRDLGMVLRGAESAQRGYLLTGDDSYLIPWHQAVAAVPRLQGDLERLTADNSGQQARLALLGQVIQSKMSELAQTIDLRHDYDPATALRVVRGGSGQALMERAEALLAGMDVAEQGLLDERIATTRRMAALTRMLTLLAALGAVAAIAYAASLLAKARRRATESEAEQRALAERLRAAIDSLSQGVGVFDASLRLVQWNHCFEALTGIGPLPMGISHDDLVTRAAAAGGLALETTEQLRHGRNDGPVVYECRQAGDSHVVEVRRTPTAEKGYVLTLSDMTKRAQAEAVLRESQKMQAIGQLTGGIAHDFNNVLTVIVGNLEFVRSRLRGDEMLSGRVERAAWAAQRGATLTGQLLAFARRQPLEPRPINLAAVLPEMVALLRRTLGEHIDVRVVEGAGLWVALADPGQLESAVLNLALNARDAMTQGGRLTIELANKVLDTDYANAHAEVTPGDYVMLAVSDTGHGMTAEVAARVFEPFFTTKPTGQGTGLGLAMVYGFVKQSGGHIKIYSEPGEGTTIRLYLPRALRAAQALARPSTPLDLPRGDATVLVVEDEAPVREITVLMLRDLGYRVLEAEDGDAAFDVFAKHVQEIDLLLTDVVLRGRLRGVDVAQHVSAARPEIGVLFMTGYTENAIVHQGRLDDGVHLLGKPFKREQLARKVADVLAARPTAAANPGVNVVDISAGRRRD